MARRRRNPQGHRDLIPYARNARIHDDAQVAEIAASIREWGFTVPVLVDEANSVIAGHGRLLAAHKLGLDTVPVMVAKGWTDNQIRAYRIADNKLAVNSQWNEEYLAMELAELPDLTALMGFAQAEVDQLANLENGINASKINQASRKGEASSKNSAITLEPIVNNSSPGQAVYDPFVGSGTTIIAAEMEARACLAMEISPAYCDVAKQRWENFIGEKAVKWQAPA